MKPLALAVILSMLAFGAEAADITLAPTGTLRAVYLAGNPAQAVTDPVTGQPRGVIVDLAGAMARQAGAPLTVEGLPGVDAVIEAVRSGLADIGFLANDPSRRSRIAFSQTYLRNPQSLVVKPGGPVIGFGDLSKPGVRVAGLRNDSIMLYIARQYPAVIRVELEPAQADPAAVRRLLESGGADAFAANRLRLSRIVEQNAGLRVLPGSLMHVPQAIVVPLEKTDRLEAVNAFLDEARRSGRLQQAIDRAANGTEIEPAPKR